MYGTIARNTPKPGMEGAVIQARDDWQGERRCVVRGVVGHGSGAPVRGYHVPGLLERRARTNIELAAKCRFLHQVTFGLDVSSSSHSDSFSAPAP